MKLYARIALVYSVFLFFLPAAVSVDLTKLSPETQAKLEKLKKEGEERAIRKKERLKRREEQRKVRENPKLQKNDYSHLSLDDMIDGLKREMRENEKKNDPCPLRCSFDFSKKTGKATPAPKKRILPYSNGCSVPESVQERGDDYSYLDPCCDLLDACYMSCGTRKQFCDDDFEKCGKKQCNEKFEGDEDSYRRCNMVTRLFIVRVSMLGCKDYVNAQKEGCDCLEPDEARRRVDEYAREFYEVFNGTHSLPEQIVSKYLGEETSSELQGELLYRLYRKYTDSIEIISRDGEAKRSRPTYFEVREKHTTTEL